jgi:hypothetical protein
VVGVTGVKWIIVQSLIKLTGRDIKLFDNREQVLEWLVCSCHSNPIHVYHFVGSAARPACPLTRGQLSR